MPQPAGEPRQRSPLPSERAKRRRRIDTASSDRIVAGVFYATSLVILLVGAFPIWWGEIADDQLAHKMSSGLALLVALMGTVMLGLRAAITQERSALIPLAAGFVMMASGLIWASVSGCCIATEDSLSELHSVTAIALCTAGSLAFALGFARRPKARSTLRLKKSLARTTSRK